MNTIKLYENTENGLKEMGEFDTVESAAHAVDKLRYVAPNKKYIVMRERNVVDFRHGPTTEYASVYQS